MLVGTGDHAIQVGKILFLRVVEVPDPFGIHGKGLTEGAGRFHTVVLRKRIDLEYVETGLSKEIIKYGFQEQIPNKKGNGLKYRDGTSNSNW